jgi:hypothetical protein
MAPVVEPAPLGDRRYRAPMKTIGILLVCVLAAGGCSKKKSESAAGGAGACAPAINKAIDGMMASRKKIIDERAKEGKQMPPGMLEGMQQMAEKLRGVLTTSCEADKWSEATIACFANATDQPSIKKCRETLAPEQAQHLQAEIIKVMGGGMGHMPGHPMKLQGSAAPATGSGSGSAMGSGSAS